jgi:hypothetical protein
MARDHARVHLDIWSDDDWRALSHHGQWLYLTLVTSPTLSFAGIADWRPARLAALSGNLSPEDVALFGAELVEGRFILPDASTEEVLIRSFVKWDGLMRTPNIAKAMVRDHGQAASAVLRAVLVDELHRLKKNEPDHGGWAVTRDLLRRKRMTFAEGVAELSAKGSDQPSDQGSDQGSEIRRPLLSPISLLPTPLSETKRQSSSSVTRGSANDLTLGGPINA